MWLNHVFGTPTLTVPRAEPLRLGRLLEARYRRRGGARRARTSASLVAELVCEERVKYRQGTDIHTATREVLRRQMPVTPDPAPDTVAGQIMVEVPVDAPPSLKLRHNAIQWSVQVRVSAPELPDDLATFDVLVVPAVASRVSGPAGTVDGGEEVAW